MYYYVNGILFKNCIAFHMFISAATPGIQFGEVGGGGVTFATWGAGIQ